MQARDSTYRETRGSTTGSNDDGFYRQQQQQQQPPYGINDYESNVGRQQQTFRSTRTNDYGGDEAEFRSYRNDDLRHGYHYGNTQNGYASGPRLLA